jgi:hypothetical protein
MIKLSDEYRIETDEYNVKLVYEREEEKKVKGELKTVKSKKTLYYGTIKNALLSYVNKELKEVPGVVQDLIDRLEELEEKIDEKF